MAQTHQYCTFKLANLWFGVEVLRVQEVLREQELTRVPLSSPVIRGLINLRGQLVTAFDMRKRLGMPDRNSGQAPMNVVIRAGDGAVSLEVDEIGDVLSVETGNFERPPETVQGAARELIRGVHKLSDRLLLILDTQKALEIPAN